MERGSSQLIVDHIGLDSGRDVDQRPRVTIFANRLLARSETFVRSQAERMSAYEPYFAGLSRSGESLALAEDHVHLLNSGGVGGKAREAVFMVSGFAPRFKRTLASLRSRVLHAHFGPCGTLAMPLATQLDIPLIVTFHGADATASDQSMRYASLTHWLYYRRRERLKRNAALFIAVSSFIRSKLLEGGYPADKVVVHRIGVDVDRFNRDPDVPREPVVLFVGRLATKKGCPHLINAMARVATKVPGARLVIIGNGPLRQLVESQAAATLPGRCTFLGAQTPEVVRLWMNRATVLAAPSVTAENGESEGLPTVIAEAQAMGLPVVATTHAGIPEALVDGESGLLVPERDEVALADALTMVLSADDSRWHAFSSVARAHAVHTLNLASQVRQLESLYDDVSAEWLSDRTQGLRKISS